MEDADQLKGFIEKAEVLCKSEYEIELAQLISALDDPDARAAYGRILGIILKEPFSSRVPRDTPSASTGATYNWLWDAARVRDESTHGTWQYRALRALVSERKNILNPSEDDVGEFIAYEGTLESRIFMFLMQSAHKNLCEHRARRRSIQTIVGEQTYTPAPARRDLPAATATVVSAIVASFGHYGVVLGPLAGGLALMIARIGLDAFCLWASEEVEKVRQIEKNAELAVYGRAALKKLREGNVDEITFPLAVDLEPPASHSEQRSTENLGKTEAEAKRRSSRKKRDGRNSDPSGSS
jgi:hypothetical protein